MRAAAKSVDIGSARFAQTSFSETFSKGGLFGGRTIDDVAGSLRSGAMSPKDVPIDVIVRDGNSPILNTRSSQVSRPGPRGEISRAPRGDCQAMLECSTLTKAQLREGVEPETGLTVIFRRHREFDGTEWWHGYVPGG